LHRELKASFAATILKGAQDLGNFG
jgi:hypothetical protein